ncbi:MAG: hypothetical protein LBK28_08960 [Propionibacteriaceae bacterium]|jgi:hypothetical protein|nr:hypothetical protein [Propionibacteriaceae bacterium]
MRKTATFAVSGALVVVLASALAGCSPTPPPVTSAPGVQESAPSTINGNADPGAADPQLLADVIDYAFPVGGNQMLRTMRMMRATSSIGAVDCGGEPFENLNYTGDRLDQLLYPDLDLIREKGMSNEPGPRPAGTRVGDDSCRYKSLPSLNKVIDLNFGIWSDATREVWNRDDIQAEVSKAGVCLEKKTGWSLVKAGATKAEYFFIKADSAVVSAANLSEEKSYKVGMKYSRIFADCMDDYSAAMRAALQAKRPVAVEQNRELLTSLAQELSAAGYVP